MSQQNHSYFGGAKIAEFLDKNPDAFAFEERRSVLRNPEEQTFEDKLLGIFDIGAKETFWGEGKFLRLYRLGTRLFICL